MKRWAFIFVVAAFMACGSAVGQAPPPATKASMDFDPSLFDVIVDPAAEVTEPVSEFLRAFIVLPEGVDAATVDPASLTLFLGDQPLAVAESPIVVGNTLDVLFPLNFTNIGTLFGGVEVRRVQVMKDWVKVILAAAPSEVGALIDLTVKGALPGGGTFVAADSMTVSMKGNPHDELLVPLTELAVNITPDTFILEPPPNEKPNAPGKEYLYAFLGFPEGMNAAEVDIDSVILSAGDTYIATAESAVLSGNTLDVCFRLSLANVSAILGLEALNVKSGVNAGENVVRVQTSDVPSQAVTLITLTVTGTLTAGDSFAIDDTVKCMQESYRVDARPWNKGKGDEHGKKGQGANNKGGDGDDEDDDEEEDSDEDDEGDDEGDGAGKNKGKGSGDDEEGADEDEDDGQDGDDKE